MTSENTSNSEGTKVRHGVVAYSDGSCVDGNPGFIGWGVHGYIYDMDEKELEKPLIINNHVVTSGSYVRFGKTYSNRRPVTPIKYIDFLGNQLDRSTNNVAEILAGLNVFRYAEREGLRSIVLITDSTYTQDGLGWCRGWIRNGWMTKAGTPVRNRELWETFYALHQKLLQDGVQIRIDWVKGHNDALGNVQADILSRVASKSAYKGKYKEDYSVADAKGYWKAEIERHPFMSTKRVLFNSVEEFNTPGTYFQVDTGKVPDHLDGKRVTEACLSIVRMNTPDPHVEAVRRASFEMANGQNSIIRLLMDRVFSKEVYPVLGEYGELSLYKGKNNLNVMFADQQPVAVEVDPTGLSMRSLNNFSMLGELLEKHLEITESSEDVIDNVYQLNSHDITKTFFDTEEKQVKGETVLKYTLKAEYVVGFSQMFLDIQEPHEGSTVTLKVPLVLGSDILPRNNLKRLEGLSPEIKLITWRESPGSIRYATVIKTTEGIGIWSNFHADKIFFKP
jgi:ribonuclease HI